MKKIENKKTVPSIGVEEQSVVVKHTNYNFVESITKNNEISKFFQTKDGKTLLTTSLKPIYFIVESFISQGLHILAGEPKVGKSWLALDLCMKVAVGENVWNFAVNKGTVLYLCLEDSDLRIQNRMFDLVNFCDEFNEDDYKDIHFSTSAELLGNGLEQQIENFIAEHNDTKLIVIDTLQKIRKVSNDSAYANDYRDLSVLKNIADQFGIAVILIHHLCKQTYGNNPINRISGTSAIAGAADSLFVLEKMPTGNKKAKLICVGRDIEERELELQFDSQKHNWIFVSDSIETPEKFMDDVLTYCIAFIKEKRYFKGTPSELANEIQIYSSKEMNASNLSRKLSQNKGKLQDIGIFFTNHRSNGKRIIILKFENSDGSDGNSIPLSAVTGDPSVPVDAKKL